METLTIYRLNELPTEIQTCVLDSLRAEPDVWGWQYEWWQSAQAFTKTAPVCIVWADFDRALAEWRWDGDDDLRDLSGIRAWKWLINNGWFDWARRNSDGECLLTGFCGDCPLSDPIRQFEHAPDDRTLEQIFGDCIQAWITYAHRDLEASYTDEALMEWVEANDMMFLADGRQV